MAKRKRPETEIEVLSKSLDVLEFLGKENFRPKKVSEIEKATNLKRNSVDRILISLKLRRYAEKNLKNEWTLGSRLVRFAENYSEFCLTVIAQK